MPGWDAFPFRHARRLAVIRNNVLMEKLTVDDSAKQAVEEVSSFHPETVVLGWELTHQMPSERHTPELLLALIISLPKLRHCAFFPRVHKFGRHIAQRF